MNTKRIKEIQEETAYPNSVSVQQALLKVWNECEQERVKNCSIPAVSNRACDFCSQPAMEGETHCEKCSVLRVI